MMAKINNEIIKKGLGKSLITKIKMSEARKRWYQNNPQKAKDKAQKMQITKILNGTHAGKNNSNYGNHKFRGIPYKGPIWNQNLTKDTNLTLKEISENEKGEKNHMWKGNNVSNGALHDWIRKNKLKPKFCERCKKNLPYDVANKSGKYKRDITDFEWLCRSCHMNDDGRILNLKNRRLKGG
jgi:hypothetical protein